MATTPRWRFTGVAVLLAAIPSALLPWVARYRPGPGAAARMAIAHVAAHPERFAETFSIDLSPRPYVAEYDLLFAIAHFLGVERADRLVSSACAIAIPLSVYFLLRRVSPEREANALLAVPVSSAAIISGFNGYLLSIALSLAAVSLAHEARAVRPTTRALAASSVLLTLALFLHPWVALLCGVGLVAMAWPDRAARRRAALVLAPAVVLLAVTVLIPHHTGAAATRCDADLVSWRSLTPCITSQIAVPAHRSPIGALVLVIADQAPLADYELGLRGPFLAMLLIGLVRGLRERRTDPAARPWLRFIAVAAAGYFLLPDAVVPLVFDLVSSGLLVLELAFLVVARMPKWLADPRRLAAVVGIGSVLIFVLDRRLMQRIDRSTAHLLAAGEKLPRGATVLPLTSGLRAAGLIDPKTNLYAYLLIERDVIVPFLNPQGAKLGAELRPLMYKKPFGPAFVPYAHRFMPRERIAELAPAYDRTVLFGSTSSLVLATLRETMDVEEETEDFQILRPGAAAPSSPPDLHP